jgi:hypothetical protein
MKDAAQTTNASSAWRCAFADALIELRPDMNPDVADELSDSAFMSLSELKPRDAATLLARDRSDSTFAQAEDFIKRGKSGRA